MPHRHEISVSKDFGTPQALLGDSNQGTRVDEWDLGLLGSSPTSAEDSGSNMNQNMGWVP